MTLEEFRYAVFEGLALCEDFTLHTRRAIQAWAKWRALRYK
jgi:hypothetical protein